MTQLLFFDTFSHDLPEELNLDLVQFPRTVIVEEVRVIPLGARVEGMGSHLGATNPNHFSLDFFVNDLMNPSASVFAALDLYPMIGKKPVLRNTTCTITSIRSNIIGVALIYKILVIHYFTFTL